MTSKWYHHIGLVFGTSIIFSFTLLAIFAYQIIPDTSKNANDQIPSLALKGPGYKTLLYKQYISNQLQGSNTRSFQSIPIKSYKIEDGYLSYIPVKGLDQKISLNEIIPPNKTSDPDQYINDHLIESRSFLFGTDKFGRDIFSRIILGIRISLLVGLIAVFISIIIGSIIGLISGYYGGLIDQLVLYLINTFWSVPTILLVFAIVIGFGRSITVIFIAVGLTMWVDVARLVRGQVISVKKQNYISIAKSIGTSNFVILYKHILPNILSSLFVIAAANFAIAILIEAGLSYLGFGVQTPVPSLGNILNENYGFALSGKLFMAIIPATAIMLLVLAFNLAGNGLRDIFDVKQ